MTQEFSSSRDHAHPTSAATPDGAAPREYRVAWSDDQIATLRKLWDEGIPASQIARQIGGSRNAVLGKIHRLGLSNTRPIAVMQINQREAGRRHGGNRSRAKAPRMAKVAKPKARYNLVAVNAVAKAEGKRGRDYDKVRTAPVVDASLAKPWLERRFGECAYPISGEGADTFSCCQPAATQGYCRAHAALMFRPFIEKTDNKRLDRLARRYA